ncbi:hypothetical protein ACFQ7M_35905 [Streptomyces massasporeus]
MTAARAAGMAAFHYRKLDVVSACWDNEEEATRRQRLSGLDEALQAAGRVSFSTSPGEARPGQCMNAVV